MNPAPTGGLVLLARMGDPFGAQLCAARLESEGIESRVHSEALGPYRLTVGPMAVTEIWVPAHALEQARLILLASEADAAVAEADPAIASIDYQPTMSTTRAVVAGVLVTAAVVALRVLMLLS